MKGVLFIFLALLIGMALYFKFVHKRIMGDNENDDSKKFGFSQGFSQ